MDEGPRLMPRPFFVFEPDSRAAYLKTFEYLNQSRTMRVSRRAGIF